MSPRHTAEPETEATEPTPESAESAADTAGDRTVDTVERTAASAAADVVDADVVDAVDAVDAAEQDGSPEPESEPDPAGLELALAERTADLQRLQAEYVNYKRRVDRDRELVRENATYAALAPIVDVLDTIDRARDSARSLGTELEAGFAAVADQLERVVSGAGLVKYGEPGDAFDPRLHEALSHIGEDPEVEVTTCKVIAKAGYRIGDRVVRAAQVLVVDPAGT